MESQGLSPKEMGLDSEGQSLGHTEVEPIGKLVEGKGAVYNGEYIMVKSIDEARGVATILEDVTDPSVLTVDVPLSEIKPILPTNKETE